MKKLFILSTLILVTPLFAQTSIQNVRNLSDISVSSYPIAPNVSISPPMWSKNLNNSNKDSNLQKNISINGGSSVPPGSIPLINIPNNGTSNDSSKVLSDSNATNVKNIQLPQSAVPAPEAAPVKNATQPIFTTKIIPKPAIILGNISTWNRTTQQQIEAKSNIDLQEKYEEFLRKK